MRLFRVSTRGYESQAKEEIVLSSPDSIRDDSEVAADASVAANGDPLPVQVQAVIPLSPLVDLDVRGSGSGPAKIFFSSGLNWIGNATQHVVASKDNGDISAAWNSGVLYFVASDPVVFGGLVYASIQDVNINHQPDISPDWWFQDQDAQARKAAEIAVIDADDPPDWDSSTVYAIGSIVFRPIGGGYWFAIVENGNSMPPGNIWQEEFFVLGTPPDWDNVTSYAIADEVTVHDVSGDRYFRAVVANLNKDPLLNSDPLWGPQTLVTNETLFRLGPDVTIEAT